ncbi:MAG: hypothetical protein K2O58_01925 [Bacteroidales bacterium]|nr:hypothetical protein [Bacteroidales bacterium]
MKSYVFLFVAASLIFAGCNRHSDEWRTILDVENYIEDRPDRALAALREIDPEKLTRASERARYAVMLSMALDKNYEDRTDFDILQPAIDWYENHGNPTDRLRTLYYQGRIYENRRDNKNAMECFVKALDAGEKSDDIPTKARTLFRQGRIHNAIYNWDKTIETNLYAAKYFKRANLTNSYINCLLRVVNCYTLKKDYANAIKYAEDCRIFLKDVRISLISEFYAIYLMLVIEKGESEETIKEAITEYLNSVPSNIANWHSISYAYYSIKDYEGALKAISRLDCLRDTDSRIRHLAIISQIHQDAGDYPKALDSFDRYITIKDSINLAIFHQDTKFIEERHTLKVKANKERAMTNYTIFASAFLLMLAGGLFLWKSHSLKISRMEKQMADSEAERYRLMCFQMEQERDNLATLITQKESLDPKVMAAISSRLELLNKFFAAHITDNCEIDKKATRELEELLSDKESFMNLTRLAFAGSKPEFISYLEECGLSEQEINYCCLYAIGLKGKEVGAYIEMRSHYNISSGIREKLGIGEHDTNLGIYIRKLMNRQAK